MGRKVMMWVVGFGLTILGVALVLRQWEAVVLVFKGVFGAILAVVGLVILFAATIKNP